MSKKHRNPDPESEAPVANVYPAAPQADGVDDVPAPSAERLSPTATVESAVDDKYIRLAAEYENYRKRTAKERMEMSARAQGDLIKRLIDPLDDLARVIAQGPGARDAKTVLDAVEVLDKKMMKALANAGLEVLNPVGEPFDPEKHEAVSTAPAASAEEDHLVAQVFQPGYVFHGQLLRPARVVVKQWNG